jgi:hypothetical protein
MNQDKKPLRPRGVEPRVEPGDEAMQDPVNSVIVFLAMCASAAAGFFVHTRLPEEHRSAQSVALLQIAITLLVTFTAIVLGLLTNSVKQGFDAAYAARGDDAAQLAELDRCLRDYGPGTADIRHALQAYTAAVIASTWPDEPRPIGVEFPDPSKMPLTGESSVLSEVLDNAGLAIRSLQPADAVHERLLAACVQQYRDLQQARWKVIEGVHASISPPFYWVLVFWLAILFGSFGLSARPNTMIVTVTVLCALSISVAVFVILDMDEPYGGLFGVPSTATRNALADMTRSGP